MADCHGDPATTCGGCQHWHRTPIDPMNLAAPRQGECRCNPPQLLVLPAPGGVRIQPAFPVLQANQEACGQHTPALATADNGRTT